MFFKDKVSDEILSLCYKVIIYIYVLYEMLSFVTMNEYIYIYNVFLTWIWNDYF